MEIDSFVSCTVITKHIFRNSHSVAGVNENGARHLLFQEVCEVLAGTGKQVPLQEPKMSSLTWSVGRKKGFIDRVSKLKTAVMLFNVTV